MNWWARRKERLLPTLQLILRSREAASRRMDTTHGLAAILRGARERAPQDEGISHQFARSSALIMSAAFSPIMMVGALVLPPIRVGMIEASTTRRPSSPHTLSFGSTTASGSLTPILQVPTG